jgi:hypothetical protein
MLQRESGYSETIAKLSLATLLVILVGSASVADQLRERDQELIEAFLTSARLIE